MISLKTLDAPHMRPVFKGSPCRAGFTLLELLISMTLMAVVIAVAAMAFNSGISAYQRRLLANRQLLPQESLAALLDRQLRGLIAPDDPALKPFIRFEGDDRQVIFTTTASPLGSGQGGMVLVVYRFLDRQGLLVYGQKAVIRPEDARSSPPSSMSPDDRQILLEKGWLCDFIPAEGVNFSYISGSETEAPVTIFSSGTEADHFKFTTRYPSALVLHIKSRTKGQEKYEFLL